MIRRWMCFWRGHRWMVSVDNRRMCSRCRQVYSDSLLQEFSRLLGREL